MWKMKLQISQYHQCVDVISPYGLSNEWRVSMSRFFFIPVFFFKKNTPNDFRYKKHIESIHKTGKHRSVYYTENQKRSSVKKVTAI